MCEEHQKAPSEPESESISHIWQSSAKCVLTAQQFYFSSYLELSSAASAAIYMPVFCVFYQEKLLTFIAFCAKIFVTLHMHFKYLVALEWSE